MLTRSNLFALAAAGALVAAISAVGAPAGAHGGAVPEHGGVLHLVGDTTLELVTSPTGVALFVEEGGEEAPSSTMSARIMLNDAAGTSVALQAGQGNEFDAKGVTLPPKSQVTVVVTDLASQVKTSSNFVIN